MQFGADPLFVGEYTPHELSLLADREKERQYQDFERILTLAWHVEAFSRQRKLPSLERIIKDVRRKPKKTDDKGDVVLRAMAAEKGVKIP